MSEKKRSTGKHSAQLENFLALINRDWAGRYRKYPDQTAFALEDDRVLDALERRFAAHVGVKAVRALDYEFYSGLHYLVFDFVQSPAMASLDAAASFLIILDGGVNVIAVVDPFDPAQPSKWVPPLPPAGEQPFVLDRPMPGKDVRFDDDALYPAQVRSRAFFQRLRQGGIIPGGLPPITNTLCTFRTTTPWGSPQDPTVDDCGIPEGEPFAF
jgi:hypothetical protein